jgi:hypothetical protein
MRKESCSDASTIDRLTEEFAKIINRYGPYGVIEGTSGLAPDLAESLLQTPGVLDLLRKGHDEGCNREG